MNIACLFYIEVCQTRGGKDPGKKCQFPFVYKNITHHKCTRHGNKRQPWCATEDSPSYPENKKFGLCGPSPFCNIETSN